MSPEREAFKAWQARGGEWPTDGGMRAPQMCLMKPRPPLSLADLADNDPFGTVETITYVLERTNRTPSGAVPWRVRVQGTGEIVAEWVE